MATQTLEVGAFYVLHTVPKAYDKGKKMTEKDLPSITIKTRNNSFSFTIRQDVPLFHSFASILATGDIEQIGQMVGAIWASHLLFTNQKTFDVLSKFIVDFNAGKFVPKEQKKNAKNDEKESQKIIKEEKQLREEMENYGK